MSFNMRIPGPLFCKNNYLHEKHKLKYYLGIYYIEIFMFVAKVIFATSQLINQGKNLLPNPRKVLPEPNVVLPSEMRKSYQKFN